jgi:hypothetical protein
MRNCRYCNDSHIFIKAHIIPEAFFRELRENQESPLLISGSYGQFAKKAPIGVYDQLILCAECELKLLPIDTYGIDVILSKFDHFFKPILTPTGSIAFSSDTVDKTKLLEFLISILWRASVSTTDFFSTVELGPHEECARTALFQQPSFIPPIFDAVLSRWDDSDDATHPTTAILNPHRERWGNVNSYRLYLGKVVAYIKVDKRPFESSFANLSLQSAGECRIVSRKLSQSKDLNAVRKTVGAAERNKQNFRAARRAS